MTLELPVKIDLLQLTRTELPFKVTTVGVPKIPTNLEPAERVLRLGIVQHWEIGSQRFVTNLENPGGRKRIDLLDWSKDDFRIDLDQAAKVCNKTFANMREVLSIFQVGHIAAYHGRGLVIYQFSQLELLQLFIGANANAVLRAELKKTDKHI